MNNHDALTQFVIGNQQYEFNRLFYGISIGPAAFSLLHNYYIEPVHSTPTTQKTNEINTTNQPNEKEKTKCLNTNHIYQNIQKEQPKEKIWTIPFLLESPKSKEFQPPDLEIDFLINSGAESNIINIPTWNEIKTLHPKLTPLETSSKTSNSTRDQH